MHQILHLDELVRNISHCADSTNKGSASLLALACCCKSLEGPVMDVLWNRQIDLHVILRTLPADSWTVVGDDTTGIFSLSRNLSRDEWERFKKYTARVTILLVPGRTDGTMLGHPVARVSAETIQIFAMESQRGEFWPRLRAVGCNIGWDFVPSISSFLTPKITSLNLTLPTESHRLLQPTLSLLTHTCRQLYSLAVDVDASDPLSGSEMVHLISASQHTLCRIQIKSPTPPDIFPVIFNCPRLRELALREPRLPNQIPPKTLPCLRTISLSGNHGSNLAAFLRSLPGLSTVNITDGEPIEFSALLGSLLGTAATINELNISPVITLDHASITSLPSFTNLTTLIASCVCWDSEASGPCNFQATDENILALGEALPHIRVLALGGPGCGAACRTTFKSLIHLSRTCGSLERLSIRVDFTSIIHDPDQLNRDNASQEINGARPQRAVNRLGTLAVGDSPLPNASRCEWVVALALVGIFPSITSLLFSCPESVQKRRWGGVKKNILVCKKILHIAQLIDT